jgi:hypothetical protein
MGLLFVRDSFWRYCRKQGADAGAAQPSDAIDATLILARCGCLDSTHLDVNARLGILWRGQ